MKDVYLSCSANAIIISVGMFLSPRALESLNNIEKIQLRMMCTSFKGNGYKAIVYCYSLTNASDESDIIIFYNELSSLVRHIPKCNVLITGEDINAQISKDENNTFRYHKSLNRNGEYLTDFLSENRLASLNRTFFLNRENYELKHT